MSIYYNIVANINFTMRESLTLTKAIMLEILIFEFQLES